MKKNSKEKKNSPNTKKVMIIQSDNKNWGESDFFPMQNWSNEDRLLWKKIIIEKKKQLFN